MHLKTGIKDEIKRAKLFWSFSVFLIITAIFAAGVSGAEYRIAAVVNNEAITQMDVEEYLAVLHFQLSSQYYDEAALASKMKDAQKDALNVLIENKLINQEAKRLGLQVDKSRIERELKDIKTRFGSEKEFERQLVAGGLNLAEFKNKIADRILMHDIVDMGIRSRVFVHPKEVTDYYNAHKEDFKTGEALDLDSIFIPFGDSESQTKDTAYKVLALLKKGEDFSKIQKEYSQGESLGLVKRSHLNEKISAAVSGLNITEISLPIRVDNGFFILKVKNIIPEHARELSEVQDVIYGFLFQRKFEEKFIEWMDGLKEKAFIIIK